MYRAQVHKDFPDELTAAENLAGTCASQKWKAIRRRLLPGRRGLEIELCSSGLGPKSNTVCCRQAGDCVRNKDEEMKTELRLRGGPPVGEREDDASRGAASQERNELKNLSPANKDGLSARTNGNRIGSELPTSGDT
jgi:hypothetical protein